MSSTTISGLQSKVDSRFPMPTLRTPFNFTSCSPCWADSDSMPLSTVPLVGGGGGNVVVRLMQWNCSKTFPLPCCRLYHFSVKLCPERCEDQIRSSVSQQLPERRVLIYVYQYYPPGLSPVGPLGSSNRFEGYRKELTNDFWVDNI